MQTKIQMHGSPTYGLVVMNDMVADSENRVSGTRIHPNYRKAPSNYVAENTAVEMVFD